MQTQQTFFSKFRWKLKRPPFYYQNCPDSEFATALLYFACSRHINKCKYLIFVKLKNISQWKIFLTNFTKNCKGRILRSIDRETSNFQVTLHFYGKNWYFIATEIGTLLLKLVLAIGTLVLFSYAFRVTYLTL